MFPDLEFIKTCLNGLRSRIEKVESWFVSNRPNWAQNDPDALDYVKGRTHYEANGKVVQLPPKFLPSPTSNTAGAIKADVAKTTDIQPVRLGTDGKLYSSGIPVFTASETLGVYSATVPEITKLVNGMLVVMIPNKDSTSQYPKLTINGGSNIYITRPVSTGGKSTFISFPNLKSGLPYLLIYTGSEWLSINNVRPDAVDLTNFVKPSNGGTGLTSLTKGSYIIGNGLSSVQQKTPSEVLADIGAIPAPATASVGQAIVVKAVDENGKPTEWEAADMGSGVGGGTVEDLPVLQSFSIEDDETNTIEFTNLQNLTEFEVEISWTWSSTTGVSGIALWLKAGFGVWRDQTPILNNGFNRNVTGKIVFKGKRLSNTVNNIAIIGGVTGSYSSSCVTRISESETADYIGLKLTTSDVFFVNGTTVILRGR